jgi:hypothetical protein
MTTEKRKPRARVRSTRLLAVEYAWPTIEDYEKDMGHPVNEAFRIGWDMARTQMAHIRALSANKELGARKSDEST